ncbi:MAG: TatD family hydrolase [Sulfurovum sp.]|nr:TatD family hydrolase [Sulfurovaceae bacterium]
MIIDTHCHLDDNRYIDDIKNVINRAEDGGVQKFIIPAADPDTLMRAVELSEEFSEVYFAVGVHPYDADRYNREFLEPFISHEKCIAIGECGLDYYRLPDNQDEIENYKELQKKVFIEQIIWAKTLKKPLIVHIRDSSHDASDLLEKYAGEDGGVIHCYNAEEELLKLSKTFYYGIGGVITFKNAKKLINIYPKIPQNRLIAETDAPYLTPHPHRGKRNEPLYTSIVIKKMAELSHMSITDISNLTTINAKKLFRI